MRVISGTCKGRPLKSVPGVSTRPTTDKVKESIFNMIGPYFDGGTALDLFAGSGGLGLEALSRGMDACIFVDREQKAIQTIHKNIESCHFEEKSEVYRNDSERALKAIVKRDLKFDVIFLDPPYKKQKLESLIEFIAEHHLLTENGVIVAEYGIEDQLRKEIRDCKVLRHETYGTTAITIYGKSDS